MTDQTFDEEIEEATDETNAERFKRVGTRRFHSAVKQIRLLKNCANLRSYEYTPEQVHTVMETLTAEVASLHDAFFPKDKDEVPSL